MEQDGAASTSHTLKPANFTVTPTMDGLNDEQHSQEAVGLADVLSVPTIGEQVLQLLHFPHSRMSLRQTCSAICEQVRRVAHTKS
jgi:hypothetical protein